MFFLLFGGEYPLVVLLRDVKSLVDLMPSRREHCFAGQRTSLESPPIILEHVHNAVDYLLREAHAPPVDFGYDGTKVYGGLRFDGLAKERSTPSMKCAAWRLW